MTSISKFWDDAIVPALTDYIRIPAKSPHFDKAWQKNGHIEAAVKLAEAWCRKHALPGMTLEVVRSDGRTPVLLLELPATRGAEKAGTILLYGHLDKQPEMVGWAEGLGPWVPVVKDGKLYGRGGADDGYAVFASLAALRHLHEEKRPHARIVALIECCEESGSYDLPHYLEHLSGKIKEPDLVIGLDSGCGNYEQLWGTTSLRGLVNGVLTVEVLEEGVHSGDASGVVPSSFRVARSLLQRVDDVETGAVRDPSFHAPIPEERREQARRAAEVLGREIHARFPFVPGMQPMAERLDELVLNRTWRPALSVTGAEGLPAPASAGNVLRPKTVLALSLRIPPTVDGERAAKHLKTMLEVDPPYGARVKFEAGQAATGWHAPATAPWLAKAVDEASKAHWGKPAMWMGEGGTIPFMAMLGAKFPKAQFLITGVLGPHANAHGPNEFLHIEYAKKLTAAVADVIAAQATGSSL
ncbi:MAG TPA: M20/M25/M40 family metallo-hydrolase [Burkholderiales bacterium]|jgi:acetylornithine deacetylase/succinyl-diaminopimelate desuccinylase-like protein|nr:M20/M25/M40 family metallo-hydrolase [Burkholderiales bacterium]